MSFRVAPALRATGLQRAQKEVELGSLRFASPSALGQWLSMQPWTMPVWPCSAVFVRGLRKETKNVYKYFKYHGWVSTLKL